MRTTSNEIPVIAMRLCPICSRKQWSGYTCGSCGYEASQDYNTYMTLCDIPDLTESLAAKQLKRLQEQRDAANAEAAQDDKNFAGNEAVPVVSMRLCPICSKRQWSGYTCGNCGYEASQDYNTYMTLCPIPEKSESLEARQRRHYLGPEHKEMKSAGKTAAADDTASLTIEAESPAVSAIESEAASTKAPTAEKKKSTRTSRKKKTAEQANTAVTDDSQGLYITWIHQEDAETDINPEDTNVSNPATPEPIISEEPANLTLRDALLRQLNTQTPPTTLTFGHYPQGENGEVEPIRWKILQQSDKGVLLLSEKILDEQTYDGNSLSASDKKESVSWMESDIRRWLNGTFLRDAFSEEEKKLLTGNRSNAVTDPVFLLSKEEYRKYSDIIGESQRGCRPVPYILKQMEAQQSRYEKMFGKTGIDITSSRNHWWLRSTEPDGKLAYTDDHGRVRDNFVDNPSLSIGIRPAIWVCLSEEAQADLSPIDRMYLQLNEGAQEITFGSYIQGAKGKKEPIQWQVLDRTKDGILLLSKYILDCKPYQTSVGLFSNIVWENSDIRRWLANDFMSAAFSAKEKKCIRTIRNKNNAARNLGVGKETSDQVFLLSEEEARKYFTDAHDRLCQPTVYAKQHNLTVTSHDTAEWWLRSAGGSRNQAMTIISGGRVGVSGTNVGTTPVGLRPALWLKAKNK